MATKREYKIHQANGKQLDELEAEFRTIIAKYCGADYEMREFDRAVRIVDAPLYRAACAILSHKFPSHVEALAQNATQLWWMFMGKPKGGFFRYDGSRPFGPYAIATLKTIALGRENRRDSFGRQTSPCGASGGQSDRTGASPRKPGTDRRQVPLAFDPIDPCTTDEAVRRKGHATTAWTFLEELPLDQREVLVLGYIDGANLSQLERERGLRAGTLHSLAHTAKRAVRRRHPDFKW